MKQVFIGRTEKVFTQAVVNMTVEELEQFKAMDVADQIDYIESGDFDYYAGETIEADPPIFYHVDGVTTDLPKDEPSLSDRCRELMQEAAQVIEKEVKRIGGISEDTHSYLNFWSYRDNSECIGSISAEGMCDNGYIGVMSISQAIEGEDISLSDWIELADDLKKIEA